MKMIAMPFERIYEGNLVLVNKNYPFRENIGAENLVPVGDSYPNILMEQCSNTHFSGLMNEIDASTKIAAISGWRPKFEQDNIYTQSLSDNGDLFTQKFVALPNHSEHQTGRAIDVGLYQEHIDFICPHFPYTGICQIFRETAPLFGFIERYPNGKRHITGIGHEPWHFRYVGYPHSMIMQRQQLTLEEYIDLIRQYPYGEDSYLYISNNNQIYVSYIRADEKNCTEFEIEHDTNYLLSGNNVDGFIMTQWRNGYE